MIAAVALIGPGPSRALAQADHLHAPAAPQKTAALQIQAQTLVDAVRSATSR